MDYVNKNNVAIFITSCLFFMMMGIVGTGAMIYDITQNNGEDNITSGIMLAISLGFVCFPITTMVIALIVYIIKMHDKNRYPVLYTESGTVEFQVESDI